MTRNLKPIRARALQRLADIDDLEDAAADREEKLRAARQWARDNNKRLLTDLENEDEQPEV
jgi:hypothetical protein